MVDPFEQAGITDDKVKKALLDVWRAYGVATGMAGVRALDTLIAFYEKWTTPSTAEMLEAGEKILQALACEA